MVKTETSGTTQSSDLVDLQGVVVGKWGQSVEKKKEPSEENEKEICDSLFTLDHFKWFL